MKTVDVCFPLFIAVVAFCVATHQDKTDDIATDFESPLFADLPTLDETREEVIQSDLLTDGELPSPEPADSLPAGPDEPQPPTLGDPFPTATRFLESGNARRLVVLTADWCGPCQQYKANMQGFTVNKSFDADIQLIDYDRHRDTYNLLNRTNNLPQTLWLENGAIRYIAGAQSRAWLQAKLGDVTAQGAVCPKCGKIH